jgi:site-specific DNA recombinase
MNALIVTRFSDAKQLGNTSTATQMEVCKTYAATSGHTVVGFRSYEAESAKSGNVARIADLLEFCKEYKGKAQILVVFKLDRFARDTGEHYYIKNELLKYGISLRSATEPIDDTPTGQLLESVLSGVAQFDNSVKRERTKLAMVRLLENGIWPWKTCIGYKNTLTAFGKAGVAQIDEACVADIREVHTKFATGTYTQKDLVEHMSHRVVINHKGERIIFHRMLINRILQDKFYIGTMTVKQWGQEFAGAHTPIIDYPTFAKCQEILNPSTYRGLQHQWENPDFPIRDRLYCGVCLGKMTAAWCTGRNKVKYAIYYCRNNQCTAPKKSVQKKDMDLEFYNYLSQIRPSEEKLKRFFERLTARYKVRAVEFENKGIKIRKQIADLENEKQAVINLAKKGILLDEELTAELTKIRTAINLAKLETVETHVEEFRLDYLMTIAENFLMNMHVIWNDLDTPAKIKLQRLLFPEKIIYSFPGFVETPISPIFSLIEGRLEQQEVTSDVNEQDVTPAGIEPAISWMKARRPGPLDDGAIL